MPGDRQLERIGDLSRYYGDHPFAEKKTKRSRYFFDNPNFRHGEAIVLYGMIRHTHPKRIVEIGSGLSSCAMLDTNDLFFDGSIRCTFIDPQPEFLLSLLRENDRKRVEIFEQEVQDTETGIFTALSPGDILFVDSSHVCKIDSDVNFVFFQVLPILRPGVFVHFHDIYYPFEYPKEWVYQGRAWNEAYLLKAFLQYNSCFQIEFFNSFLGCFYRDRLAAQMPLCSLNPGSSLWIRRSDECASRMVSLP